MQCKILISIKEWLRTFGKISDYPIGTPIPVPVTECQLLRLYESK